MDENIKMYNNGCSIYGAACIIHAFGYRLHQVKSNECPSKVFHPRLLESVEGDINFAIFEL